MEIEYKPLPSAPQIFSLQNYFTRESRKII